MHRSLTVCVSSATRCESTAEANRGDALRRGVQHAGKVLVAAGIVAAALVAALVVVVVAEVAAAAPWSLR